MNPPVDWILKEPPDIRHIVPDKPGGYEHSHTHDVDLVPL